MTNSEQVLPILAAAVLLTLAGCAGTGTTPDTQTPTATATDTPTETATPDPTTDEEPEDDNLTLPESWNTPADVPTPPPAAPEPEDTAPIQPAETPTPTPDPTATPTPTPTPTATPTPTPTPTPDPPTREDLRVSHSGVQLTDDAAVVEYTVENTHEQTVRATLEGHIRGDPEPGTMAYRDNRSTVLYQTPVAVELLIHGGGSETVRIEYDGERWQNATGVGYEVRLDE